MYVEQQADALARDQENMKKKVKGRNARYLSVGPVMIYSTHTLSLYQPKDIGP